MLSSDIGQTSDGGQSKVNLRCRPALGVHPSVEVEVAFEAVQEPVAQCTFQLRLPRFAVPAALVLWLLNQRYVVVGLDQVDALRTELTVVFWPLGGNLGDRCRAMPLKPGRFQFACGHLAG